MSPYAVIGLAVVSLAAASCVLNFITFFAFNKDKKSHEENVQKIRKGDKKSA